MNGAHDVGGMDGLGAVEPDSDEAPFHSGWEGRVFGMMVSTVGRGLWSAHEFRHANERMHPAHYLFSPYFERWLYSLERNLEEHGHATRDEIASRVARLRDLPSEVAPSRWDDPGFVDQLLERVKVAGVPTHVELGEPPRYSPGDVVRARNIHPEGHTRLPRYARGRKGVVQSMIGAFPLPDAHAHGDYRAEYCYVIEFDGQELWGVEDAEPNTRVHLDLWEGHLEPEPVGDSYD